MTTASPPAPGLRGVFAFPDPVNEKAVRITAAGVAVIAAVAVLTQRPEPLVVLAYGFLARVLAGPRLSPLALLSTRVVAPRLRGRPRLVPGPPKRFAQGIGAAVSVTAVLLYYFANAPALAFALVGAIVVLATLEAATGICVGCMLHAWLARRGIIRSDACEECADVSLRLGSSR